MGIKYYCDLCKKEVGDKWELHKSSPTYTNHDPRSITSVVKFMVDVKFNYHDLCQDCLFEETKTALFHSLRSVKETQERRWRSKKDEKHIIDRV